MLVSMIRNDWEIVKYEELLSMFSYIFLDGSIDIP